MKPHAAILIALILPLVLSLSACTVELPMADEAFPRAEPAYVGKAERDFSMFEEALATFTPARAAELDALLTDKSVLEIQEMLDGGQTTSEELVTYYVDRIRRYDVDKLNSVMALNPAALDIARALDTERTEQGGRGSLHGIPVLLKDNIATGDGMTATAGALALQEWQPDRDAFLVQQLRAAGAVILGKANLSEWANYMDPEMPSGFSVLGGQTRNPYGPFEVWGSSSGSAVAAAANLATVTVGTETQGSIIMPADINSVVGLKTSMGLVSRDYVVPLLEWQDVPGPMGRTVTDVAVLLTAMAGVDAHDPVTADAAAAAGVDFTQFLSAEAAANLRLGIIVFTDEDIERQIERFELSGEEAENLRGAYRAVNEAERATGRRFSELGLAVVEISGFALPAPVDVGAVLPYGFRDALNSFLAGLGDQVAVGGMEEIIAFNNADLANRAPYGQDYLIGSQNSSLSEEEYLALKEQHQSSTRDALSTFFADYAIDVLLSDVNQTYAPAGFPALTVPAGYDEEGRPFGITMIADYLGESKLIAAGYAFEQATNAREAPDLETTIQQIEALN